MRDSTNLDSWIILYVDGITLIKKEKKTRKDDEKKKKKKHFLHQQKRASRL